MGSALGECLSFRWSRSCLMETNKVGPNKPVIYAAVGGSSPIEYRHGISWSELGLQALEALNWFTYSWTLGLDHDVEQQIADHPGRTSLSGGQNWRRPNGNAIRHLTAHGSGWAAPASSEACVACSKRRVASLETRFWAYPWYTRPESGRLVSGISSFFTKL